MPLDEVLVSASPIVNALLPTGLMALLALKAPSQLDEGGRVGRCQEDWAHADSGIDQCDNKVGRIGLPSGVGRQQKAMVEPTVPEQGTSCECSPPA
jgi:hypothetical protein